MLRWNRLLAVHSCTAQEKARRRCSTANTGLPGFVLDTSTRGDSLHSTRPDPHSTPIALFGDTAAADKYSALPQKCKGPVTKNRSTPFFYYCNPSTCYIIQDTVVVEPAINSNHKMDAVARYIFSRTTIIQSTVIVLMLGVIIAHATREHGKNYRHFTAWNFTSVLLLLVTDLYGRSALPLCVGVRRILALYILPIVLASVTLVAAFTALMYGWRFGVVQEAYRVNTKSLVDFMNFVLHGLPVVVSYTFAVFSLDRLQASVLAPRAVYVTSLMFTAVCYSSSYFYVFSPQAEYEFDIISNETARLGSIAVLFILAIVFSSALTEYWKSFSYVKSIKTV